jgi:hypothetical protein
MEIQVKDSFRELVAKAYEDIPLFVHEILEMESHQGQDACWKGMRLKHETAIHSGNRFGKGEIVCGYGSWLAAYKPVDARFKDIEIPILNTSISQDQANIVFDKMCKIIERANPPKFSMFVQDIKASPFPHIIFRTGVTWWFRNASQDGKYLEGRSYFWINFDECDLQPNYQYVVDEILAPRVWDFGGGLSHTTTPRRGKRNAYKIYSRIKKQIEAGDTDCFVYQGDSRLNRFLHPSAIDRMNKLPRRLLNKNVRGEFEDVEGSVTSAMLEYANTVSIGAQLEPQAGHRYLNAWDFARRSTFLVGVTLDVTTSTPHLVSVERYRDPKENRDPTYWQGVVNKVHFRHRKWGGLTAYDSTGVGDVVSSYIQDINAIGVYLTDRVKGGLITCGLDYIQNGRVGIPYIEIPIEDEVWSTHDELLNFDEENTDKIIWDFVCALFIGLWVSRGKHSPDSTDLVMPSVVGVKGASKYVAIRSAVRPHRFKRSASRALVRR